jgi:hypothetical protein
MGEDRLPEALRADLDRALRGGRTAGRIDRRRCFRQMVKGEIEDQPLTWLRRRALVQFAARLQIDAFEARLLIRAVEYECGHVEPAAMDDAPENVDRSYLLPPEYRIRTIGLALIMLAGGLAGLIGLWLQR